MSANSLNTLYGSYYGTVTNTILPLFGNEDIRKNLLEDTNKGVRPKKFDGIATSAATSNIPIFRRSEMALIIAEVEARANNIADAQKYLFYTAKRNKAITAPEQLPSTTTDLLTFISEERIREFFCRRSSLLRCPPNGGFSNLRIL
ncbi:MAG: RagB/SusD family nutrient uptake outer membrane protein [Bacteroides sp.]|nr:RagB/SusD family nutrient uptake outer membrane protein [Bacteroides sp.]